VWRLVRGLGRLLHSWWRRDCIRVSPREGRLLGLAPPCIVLINREVVEVLARVRSPPGGNARVTYHCRTRTGSAELHVRLDEGERSCHVHWRTSGQVRDLAEDDVEVLGSGDPRG
jgi:hypothetical protein